MNNQFVIIVKSFKRPYLLDFTLRSIFQNVDGVYRVVVIDDGSGYEYLEKIRLKYKNVIFEKTRYFELKSTRNETLRNENGHVVLPHRDWFRIVDYYASHYFMLLEDDQFVFEKINVDELCLFCKRENLEFLNLNVLNPILPNQIGINEAEVIKYYSFKFILKTIKFLFNSSSLNSIKWIRRLRDFYLGNYYKLDFQKDLLPLYSMYTISGCIMKKKYYMICNESAKDEVNENAQLHSALKYNLKKCWTLKFGIMPKQYLKTSFSNSVISDSNDNSIDLKLFNEILNQKWLSDDLMYFNEILWEVDAVKVKIFLDNLNDERLNPDSWQKYVDKFKKTYVDLGFNV
jgi:hypothetical protein